MATHESLVPENLQERLQSEFGFTLQDGSEWLTSDDFEVVGGVERGEILPSRTRISLDGTRFEQGCRIEDLEALLALSKLKNPGAQDLAALRDFWPENSPFTSTEEDGYLYIGSPVQTVPDGTGENMYGFWLGYDIALEAAQRGLSYDAMRAGDWHGYRMRQITNYSEELYSTFVDAEEEQVWDSGITANNLREFPLATNETSWRLPGTLTIDGQTLQDQGIRLSGRDRDGTVGLQFRQSTFDYTAGQWNNKSYRLALPVPEGAGVQTVDDLVHLRKVIVSSDSNDHLPVTVDVRVTVEDNRLTIASEDESLKLEVCAPVCEDCHIPEWKFRWPTAAEFAEQEQARTPESDVALRDTSYGGVFGYHAFLDHPDGSRHEYCIDHIADAEQRYLEEHPYASRTNALALARQALDALGYSDVQVERRLMNRALGQEQGWWVCPIIRYERNGKEITRFITGDAPYGLVISDDGEVRTALPSREYVDFR